jgi:hypothetical protein
MAAPPFEHTTRLGKAATSDRCGNLMEECADASEDFPAFIVYLAETALGTAMPEVRVGSAVLLDGERHGWSPNSSILTMNCSTWSCANRQHLMSPVTVPEPFQERFCRMYVAGREVGAKVSRSADRAVPIVALR